MASQRRKIYDTLIIGSGASGGWVAKELTERGLTVLMLEAGPPRVPTRDFTEHVWPYQLKFRGFGNQQQLLGGQPVQRLCYACDEYSHQFFVNDLEHPYTFPTDKPFMWIRGRQVGGKTFCWARESYRFSDNEFKAASRDGYGEDWPIGYKDLEPYYDRVESFIGVSGSREGLPQMPDGKFLPPMALSCGGMMAKEVIERKFGWRVMPDRVANLTVNHRGPSRLPLLRSVSAWLFYCFVLQQSFRHASGGGQNREIYSRERRHCQPLAHGSQRTWRGRPLH
jgi:choline dehydrogenase-like flavoprotein